MTRLDAAATAPRRAAFGALSLPGYRWYLGTYVFAMMADNIEHVISYWVAFQKFHSPALGGFAVVSHWLPYLLFSVPAGALADRGDPRRIIQAGMLLFMLASLGWGYFFVTDSLQMWHAMTLLVIHGFAGVLWQTSSQLLLHDLNATARYLGILVGPAVGGLIMLTLGPSHGIFLNAAFYLPLVLWLWKAPYGPRFRPAGQAPMQRAVRGLADIVQTIRDISGSPMIVSMTLLAGAASFFVGNSYHAQMPSFAHDLGHGDPGVSYSMLLAADASGALLAGYLLERLGLLKSTPRTALLLAMAWGVALAGFALARSYPLALLLLFAAGFLELSFNSMAQALVQIHAVAAIRGRVIGLYNMSALGMRSFSGFTVGLAGSVVGVHTSLAVSALALLLFVGGMTATLRAARAT